MDENAARSAVMAKLEADNAKLRLRFMEEIPCLTHTDLAAGWKASGKVFSVQLGDRELFPKFQFKDGKPDPAIAQILDALPSGMSQWQVAFWFVSSNPWLDGGVPSENLDNLASVVEAAHKSGEPFYG